MNVFKYFTLSLQNLTEIPLQNGCPMPSASSEITMARVTSSSVLTKEEAVKKTLCLKLNTQVNIPICGRKVNE